MRRAGSASKASPSVAEEPKNKAVELPDEIVLQIINYILAHDDRLQARRATTSQPQTQTTLGRLCLVDRQWYRVTVPHLYSTPWLYGHSFEQFVHTICPTFDDPVRRSDLAGHVKELDLRLLVYQGSKSTTARLIGRTKKSLEVFRAPRSTFGINCLAALSKCTKLRILDLRDISGRLQYDDFTRTLSHLQQLEALDTPRLLLPTGSGEEKGANKDFPWPASLSSLRMSKLHDASNGFMWLMFSRPQCFPCSLPRTLTKLVIQDAIVNEEDIITALERHVPELKDLTLTNCNHIRGFNVILDHASKLERLCISINLITEYFPDFSRDSDNRRSHPLRHLEIATCSGSVELRSNIQSFFSNVNLSQALAAGKLPNLRRVDIWKMAAVRFRIDEFEYGLVHAQLVQLGLQDGYEGAGMRVVEEPGWDGMITLE